MPKRRRRKRALFSKRFVGFVDILGFEELVKRMRFQPRLFKTIRDALNTVVRQERRARKRGRLPAVQMTAFSDCYVISADVAHGAEVLWNAHWLAAHLLTEGIVS